MENDLGRIERWLLALFFFAGFSAVFWRILQLTADIPKDKMGDYATWFSGLGTMAAVFTAYLVGERQARAAREQAASQERARERERLASIFAILETCEAETQKFADVYELDSSNRLDVALAYERRVFDSLATALSSVALTELRSATAIRQMVVAQHAFGSIKRDIEEFLMREIPLYVTLYNGKAPQDHWLRLSNAKGAFARAHTAIKTALNWPL